MAFPQASFYLHGHIFCIHRLLRHYFLMLIPTNLLNELASKSYKCKCQLLIPFNYFEIYKGPILTTIQQAWSVSIYLVLFAIYLELRLHKAYNFVEIKFSMQAKAGKQIEKTLLICQSLQSASVSHKLSSHQTEIYYLNLLIVLVDCFYRICSVVQLTI